MPRFVQALTALAVLALAQAALAQEEQPPPPPEEDETAQPEQTTERKRPSESADVSTIAGAALRQPGAPRVTVRGSYRLQFESDLEDDVGDVSINRALAGVTLAGAWTQDFSYSLDFQFEHSAYDFDDATGIIPGTDDPLDDAVSFDITPSFRYAVNERWGVRGAVSLEFAGESDADFDKSIRGNLFAGVEHKFSDDLWLTFGVIALSRFEDDADVFPFIGVRWQINELMRLQTRGLGAEFISQLGNDWTLGAWAAYETRDYRLSGDSDAPLRDGVFRDDSIVAGVELAWRPDPNITIALEGGGVFEQNFEVLDNDGNDISRTDADGAFFAGVRASIAF